jgi:hypothetical protein
MGSYTVQLVFNDGTNTYTFPLVQSVSDPEAGIKAVVIEGNRADGVIVIPGGKKSVELRVQGILFDADGYADLTTLIADMRSKVTTAVATLTLKHWTGATWQNDWSYTVRRVDPIDFPESSDLRTESQPYECRFLIISY